MKSKKIHAKKLVKSNNFFTWNCIFGSFNFFPSSKIDYWPFLKLQKTEFGQNKISWNWFHEFFWHGLFKIFWPIVARNTKQGRRIIFLSHQIDPPPFIFLLPFLFQLLPIHHYHPSRSPDLQKSSKKNFHFMLHESDLPHDHSLETVGESHLKFNDFFGQNDRARAWRQKWDFFPS